MKRKMKMLKIPRSINVAGKEIRIKKIKSWKGHPDITGKEVGRFYPDTRTIYINTNYSEDTQIHFIAHEINHVILFLNGCNQNMSLDLEECISQSVATFYYDYLRMAWTK